MSDETSQSVTDSTTTVAAAELRQFVERIERLEAEKKDIADAQKEVMAEARLSHCASVTRMIWQKKKPCWTCISQRWACRAQKPSLQKQKAATEIAAFRISYEAKAYFLRRSTPKPAKAVPIRTKPAGTGIEDT